MPYLEVKTVEQLCYKGKRGEEDLQGVDVCSMSLTQVDRSLEIKKFKKVSVVSISTLTEQLDLMTTNKNKKIISTLHLP